MHDLKVKTSTTLPGLALDFGSAVDFGLTERVVFVASTGANMFWISSSKACKKLNITGKLHRVKRTEIGPLFELFPIVLGKLLMSHAKSLGVGVCGDV